MQPGQLACLCKPDTVDVSVASAPCVTSTLKVLAKGRLLPKPYQEGRGTLTTIPLSRPPSI